MWKFDLGKTIQDAANVFGGVVGGAVDTVNTAAGAACEAVGNVANGAVDLFNQTMGNGQDAKIDYSKPLYISKTMCLKIIYLFMNVDGVIEDEEQELFNMIGKSLFEDYDAKKENIVQELDSYIHLIEAGNERLIAAKTCINTMIQTIDCQDISPLQMLAYLLMIAYSDRNMHETELKFIEYMKTLVNLDDANYVELKHAIETIIEIDQEISWVKSTNLQYLKIEKKINELENRKLVVQKNIQRMIEMYCPEVA